MVEPLERERERERERESYLESLSCNVIALREVSLVPQISPVSTGPYVQASVPDP